jgi:hypothetical protein
MLVGVIIISAAMGAGPAAVDSAVPAVPGLPRSDGPTPTPDVSNDYRRAVDLGLLREAAREYYQKRGSFPNTGGRVVALCAATVDAGCALREARGLPSGDGESPYYYVSDGASYAVFIARTDFVDDPSACPKPLPRELAEGTVMCARAEAAR